MCIESGYSNLKPCLYSESLFIMYLELVDSCTSEPFYYKFYYDFLD